MTAQEKLKYQTALFVASLRENLLIPQTSIDFILDGACKLVEDYLQITQDALTGGEPMPADVVKEAFRNCEPSTISKHCKGHHKILSFMEEQLNRVDAEKVCIGKQQVWSKAGQLVEEEYFAYIPPFLQSLQLCLNNPIILSCVDNPLPHEERVLRSVLDVHYYRSHEVFLNGPNDLAFEIYEDDVQITNALSTKVHKLAMFYWTLVNIHPEFRSNHRVHNLLAITSSNNAKHFGVKPILANFIKDMKLLGRPEGVKLAIGNQERVFHGLLVLVAGDTPASSMLGGFKESVGGARRPCRRCLISKEELKFSSDASSFILRNAALHAQHLSVILNQELTPNSRAFWSKQYGVKSESCLLEIGNVDVTSCLPHDFMHTVLEGVLQTHATAFIKHRIFEGKFTLEDFNTSLANFEFGCFTKDKPSRIEQTHLQNGIRQNAVQMLTLGQTLPFLIGRWLDDSVKDHLSVFVLLMQIVNMCLAFVLFEGDADIINLMVWRHHERFKALYADDKITPKWHYFLHIGEQIVLFGPPRQYWCKRLEALHSYFKHVAQRLRNFRNLSLSLAQRKQNLQCVDFAYMPGIPRKPFLYHGNKVISKTSKILRSYAHCDLVSQMFPGINPDNEILCASSIEVLGSTFKKGLGILLDITDDALPQFGKVHEAVVWDEKVAIVYCVLETSTYESRLNAYQVRSSVPTVLRATLIDNLILKHILPILKYDSEDFIILTYYRRSEFSE